MADQISIDKQETGSGGRYVAVVSGHEAEMAFSRASPHLIIIDHTAVQCRMRYVAKVWGRPWRCMR